MKVQPFSFNKDIPNVTYVTVLGASSVTDQVNFTNASIGGPGFIVVGVHGSTSIAGSDNLSPASVTIGGVAATLLVETADKRVYSGLWGRTISAGTTANINVQFFDTIQQGGVGIWRVTGLNSETPIATTSNAFSSRNSFTLSVTPTGQNQILIVQTGAGTAESQTYSPNIENYDNNRSTISNQSGGSTTLSQLTTYTLTVTTGTATTGLMGGVAVLLR